MKKINDDFYETVKIDELEELAEEHAEFIKQLYKMVFKHGFKHGKEERK